MSGLPYFLAILTIGAFVAPMAVFQSENSPSGHAYDGQTANAVARQIYRVHNAAVIEAHARNPSGSFTLTAYPSHVTTTGFTHCATPARVTTIFAYNDLPPIAETARALDRTDLGTVGFRLSGVDYMTSSASAACTPSNATIFITTRL